MADAQLRRNNLTWYRNQAPITDKYEALQLLCWPLNTTAPILLSLFTAENGMKQWEIALPWLCGIDGDSDSAKYYYFQVFEPLAMYFVTKKLVEPYTRKYWGGVKTECHKFVYTQDGLAVALGAEKRELNQAARLFKFAVEDGLAVLGTRTNFGREDIYFGPFFVDYELPNGKKYRVYPEANEYVLVSE